MEARADSEAMSPTRRPVRDRVHGTSARGIVGVLPLALFGQACSPSTEPRPSLVAVEQPRDASDAPRSPGADASVALTEKEDARSPSETPAAAEVKAEPSHAAYAHTCEPSSRRANHPDGMADGPFAGVALSVCVKKGGPRGPGHATVTFAPSGQVESVVVDSGSTLGTPAAKCVATQLCLARVAPFWGARVRIGKSFSL